MTFWQVYGLMNITFGLGIALAVYANGNINYGGALGAIVPGVLFVAVSTFRKHYRVIARSTTERES